MAPRSKSILQYAGMIVPVICILAGIVSAFAIQGEKVRQLEQCAVEIKYNATTETRYNSEEHKMILQSLAEIKGMLKDPRRRLQ